MDLERRTGVLVQMKETAQTMRVGSWKSLLQFQKGLIISSNSLPELYEHLKQQYNIQFLLTHRRNQDLLENFFGCLSQSGGSIPVKYRIRAYLLSKDTKCLELNNTNTKDTAISEDYVHTGTSQTGNHNLDNELILSAILFSTCDLPDAEKESNHLIADFPETNTLRI